MDILRRFQRQRVEAAMEEDFELKMKQMTNFLDEEDSDDSAIGSSSDESAGSGEDTGAAPDQNNTGEPVRELETNHEDLVMYGHRQRTINAKLLRLPPITEEVIGSWDHPALTRYKAFSEVHGRIYKSRVLDHIEMLPCDLTEAYVFADSWIRFRINQISPINPTMTRIFNMYNHVLHNQLTPVVCREICVITRYRDKPETLLYMEMHLAYRFDPCYNTVMETARNAYRPAYVTWAQGRAL